MKKLLIPIMFGAYALVTSGYAAEGESDLTAGKDLYGQLCYACHDTGVEGAPRLGQKEDWHDRLRMGEDTLYAAVIEGPNHMFSKGNSPLESEAEIRSIIAYMMSSVTDDETRPLLDTATQEEKDRHMRLLRGYKNYDLVCFSCHDKGDIGAPRLGKPEDWSGRSTDIEVLTDNVTKGKGHMFMRAGTANMSRADYSYMVEYMLSTLEK